MKEREPIYKELVLNTSALLVPREAYQRELNNYRVDKIAKQFDERIANEPKVSFRDGKYYVFDGQHTIAARKHLNNDKDINIKCKVYYGMTEADEALLFAQQFGASAKLTSGAKIRALIFAGDPDAMRFLMATEKAGLKLDYGQGRGKKRIGCINTAFIEFMKLGEERYIEALNIITEAWDGDPDSYRKEILQGVTRFVDLYYGMYNRKRLVRRLNRVHPMTIYREGKATGTNFQGYKKYLHQVFRIYNGSSKKDAVDMKF